MSNTMHTAHLHRGGAESVCGQSATSHNLLYPLAGFRALSGANASGRVCKRCLASLAKRDRAFQRKSKDWFNYDATHSIRWGVDERAARYRGRGSASDAARAIAREAGQ